MAYLGEGGIQDIRNRIFRERGTVTLDSNGNATVTFSNPVPSSSVQYVTLQPWITAGSAPIVANVTGWTTSGSNTTGFTIEASRLRSLPNPLTLLTQLIGFNIFTGTGASGARVDWMFY